MELDEALALAANSETLLKSPHDQTERWNLARKAMDRALPGLDDAIERLIAETRSSEARRVLAASLLIDPAPAGARAKARDKAFRTLSLDRDRVRRVVQAADRCRTQLDELAGSSTAIRQVRAAVWRACFGASLYDSITFAQVVIREQNVLIRGDTGTGKELVALAIAEAAVGSENDLPPPWQALNVAALPRELVESELFGHVAGAFSGAQRERIGKLAAAAGGTIFLDEVADLPMDLQPKLLRAIETRHITPLGANQPVAVDVRFVSATARPLEQMVDEQRFRRDLYQRLAGVTIRLPTLADRREDVPIIAKRIFDRMSRRLAEARERSGAPSEPPRTGAYPSMDIRLASIEDRLAEWLSAPEVRDYDWPGNVRELASLVRTRIMGFDETVPTRGASAQPLDGLLPPEQDELRRFFACEASLDEVQDWYVQRVLAHTQGNLARAARVLGIDRGTLARHLKRIRG